MIEWDASQIRALAQDLGKVPGKAVPEVTKVVTRGALNVKTGWAKRWSGHAHAPGLPGSISFDMQFSLGGIGAEIGPTKGGPGSLGNIYEFGVPGTAAQPGGMPALADEEPKFEQALTEAMTDLLEG